MRIVFITMIVTAWFGALGFIAGYLTGQAYTRAEAVEAGAGNYTPDGRTWEWRGK